MSTIRGAQHALETLAPPASVIGAWPADEPLAVCTAGPRARWTLLARPAGARPIRDPADLCCTSPAEPDRTGPARTGPVRAGTPPLRSGKLLALSYHLGAALEPTAGRPPEGRPLGAVLEIPGVLAHDNETGAWRTAGDAGDLLEIANRLGAGRLGADRLGAGRVDQHTPAACRVGEFTSDLGREGYMEVVRRGLDAIAAGDVYQVNLAHRLRAPFEGSPRAFFAALLGSASPRHGAYFELPGLDEPEATARDGSRRRPTPPRRVRLTAICSASPELSLRYDAATRRVTTQPMKGTRPISGDPEELRASPKDRAELDMITDLMRNDLGRVCAFGSVRVDAARTIEPHASSVWQATSTVSGTLRDGLTHEDLIGATFPPGSVTGAPKIRAMQLIDELEPSPRGYYCGSLGWVDESGNMELNVAIRTAQIELGEDGHSELHYHAGAGIVADSEPGAEWAETLEKAAVLHRLLDPGRHDSPSSAQSCTHGH